MIYKISIMSIPSWVINIRKSVNEGQDLKLFSKSFKRKYLLVGKLILHRHHRVCFFFSFSYSENWSFRLSWYNLDIDVRVNEQISIDCVWFWVEDFMVQRLQYPKHLGTSNGYQVQVLYTNLQMMEKYLFGIAMQLNTRSVCDFPIYLTEITFKQYFKLSTINFPRNLPFYKIEYHFISLSDQWRPSLIFLHLFIHMPFSQGNSSTNNVLAWLSLKAFLQSFLKASLIPLMAITPIKDDICASDHCEPLQVGHVLYLDLTSHFCSHHCGQLNGDLVRSLLTVVCRLSPQELKGHKSLLLPSCSCQKHADSWQKE